MKEITSKEKALLEEIKNKINDKERYNLYNCNPVYVVYIRGENIYSGDENSLDLIEYVVEDKKYDSLKELKCYLKNKLFLSLFQNKNYLKIMDCFSLDSNSDLFSFCSTKSPIFFEVRNKLINYFNDINKIKSLNDVFFLIVSFNKKENLYIEDFPLDIEKYKVNKYNKKFIPVAILSNHSIALKTAKHFASSFGETKVIRYSSDKENCKIEDIRKVLLKII